MDRKIFFGIVMSTALKKIGQNIEKPSRFNDHA